MSKKVTMVIGAQSRLVEEIAGFLRHHGYTIQTANNLDDALAEIPATRPQIILLLTGPHPSPADIWQVCHHGRRMTDVAVLVITFDQRPEDRTIALRAGADACLTWPVDLNELLARIEALLRRGRQFTEAKKTPHFVQGDLWVDLEAREVWVKGERKDLTPREFDLLVALIECSRRRVKNDSRVLHSVWLEAGERRDILRQYIWRLRRKIEPDPRAPVYILYEPGYGYRLAD
jgi:two-component system KDP operon response regulator KdpE